MSKSSEEKLKKIKRWLKKAIFGMETVLAFIILLAVILSTKDLMILIYNLVVTDALESYEFVQGFLSYSLLLVVGLELALMLLTHTSENVLEVILYAIARKMLIKSTNSVEILLGVIALGIIFFINKYLLVEKNKLEKAHQLDNNDSNKRDS